MKNNFILLLLLLVGYSESALTIDCDEDKMNIVYYLVDNPISFSVNGYDLNN